MRGPRITGFLRGPEVQFAMAAGSVVICLAGVVATHAARGSAFTTASATATTTTPTAARALLAICAGSGGAFGSTARTGLNLRRSQVFRQLRSGLATWPLLATAATARFAASSWSAGLGLAARRRRATLAIAATAAVTATTLAARPVTTIASVAAPRAARVILAATATALFTGLAVATCGRLAGFLALGRRWL
jgi:hypothetical protein